MNEIKTVEDWNSLLAKSKEHAVVILKHSNICPISKGAYDRISEALADGQLKVPVNLVIVQNARDVSNQIAEDLGVLHESPQVIVIKDGQAIYNESHHAIEGKTVQEHVT